MCVCVCVFKRQEASEIQVRPSWPPPSSPTSPKDASLVVGSGGGAAASCSISASDNRDALGNTPDGDAQQHQSQRQQQQQQQSGVGSTAGGKGDPTKKTAGAGVPMKGIGRQSLLESMDVFSLGCVIAEVRLVACAVMSFHPCCKPKGWCRY